MNNKNDEINIEEPLPGESPEKSDPVQPAEEARAEQPTDSLKESLSKKLPVAKPGKTRKFFQTVLMWLIVIVVAFGAGFLLDHFLRYRPLAESLQQTQTQLAELQTDLDEAENQVELMTPKLEAANARIATLEDDLEMAGARVQLYQMLVDVSNARLSLFLEDIEDAQAALAETKTGLDALGSVIEKVDEELAQSLPNRLDLIIAELERDPETAAIDLELLTKDLLALDALMFDD